jgi:hypothetical protein
MEDLEPMLHPRGNVMENTLLENNHYLTAEMTLTAPCSADGNHYKHCFVNCKRLMDYRSRIKNGKTLQILPSEPEKLYTR